ncbi:DUF5606 family protein [Solitalea koreensis]|uniref:Uncharacterized protein n=1 Tax=Solitalea koreensis TaxID=543615 RepID=A0A521AGU8_9SPHI|nr:DUF5606 domain-containing protein [Solitalea koreensis]SMO34041.1 hypothetical protein SAMN06265350_101150 [Solitalea koreensis]
MNLRGIVSVAGKPGLYKVIGQNKAGFVLESMDAARNKVVINGNARVAALREITVYGENEDLQLINIFENMSAVGTEVPDVKADNNVLKTFFAKVAPEHDGERVYVSDIKKIVSWYKILSVLPLWGEEDPDATVASESTPEAIVKEEEIEEKPKKAKKTTKKAE